MNSFTRATTPTHRFTLPLSMDAIKRCRLTYSQRGVNVITRDTYGNEYGVVELSRVSDSETMLTVKLSQADTAMFKEQIDVEIQARIITASGDALASDVVLVGVDKVLDDEVLEWISN